MDVARRTTRLVDGVAGTSFSVRAGEAPLLLAALLVALVLRRVVDIVVVRVVGREEEREFGPDAKRLAGVVQR